MKNTNRVRLKTFAITAATITATSSAQAAIIALSADAANSTAQFAGFSVAATLTDGFAYNPDDPNSPAPQNLNAAQNTAAHGARGTNGVDAVFAYTTTHIVAASETIFIDLWGRNTNRDRDDDFSVQLDLMLAGGGTTTVTATGGSLPDTGTPHQRLTFTGISAGDTITNLRIIGVDSDGDIDPANTNGGNFFTITEVRLASNSAAVPEPSSTALLGLGGLALIFRRRK